MPQPVEGVDGNWRCTNCNNINFGTRAQCNRCSASRAHAAANPALNALMLLPDGTAGQPKLMAATSAKDARGLPIDGVDGNWRCHSCQNINFATRQACNRCSKSKSDGDVGIVVDVQQQQLLAASGGDYASQLAAANYQQQLISHGGTDAIATLQQRCTQLESIVAQLQSQMQQLLQLQPQQPSNANPPVSQGMGLLSSGSALGLSNGGGGGNALSSGLGSGALGGGLGGGLAPEASVGWAAALLSAAG